MDKVMECVALAKPMMQAVQGADYDKLESITKTVFKTEHEADLIKDEIRQTIPKTFYLPVYRGDLLGHLKLQDDRADAVEDLAVLLTIKRLPLPDAIEENTSSYVDTVLEVCAGANKLAAEMQNVVDGGMKPDQIEVALKNVAAVEKAEWRSDRVQYSLCKALFALEGQISPIDIMLWFKIFGKLGDLANSAESLADRVRRMLTSR